MGWIMANIGTIIVGIMLTAVIVAIIIKMVNDKKKGVSSCGCGCANCAMKGSCHKQ
jgi:hypothetical protein